MPALRSDPESCHGLSGQRAVRILRGDDRLEVDPREIALLLGFSQWVGVDNTTLQLLPVFSERRRGELNHLLLREGLADPRPRSGRDVMGLVDEQVTEFGQEGRDHLLLRRKQCR